MADFKTKNSRNQGKVPEAFNSLERRVEKIEKSMNIIDEMNLIAKEQEESKQLDIDRRLDSLDIRLRRIEVNITNFIIDLEDKIEQHEGQISMVKQIPMIKTELEDLKCSFYTDERIAALEKELNLKMLKMFETIEELSRNVSYKEKEIERLKREINDLKNENDKYVGERDQQSEKIRELVNQIEEIWKRQEIIDSEMNGQRVVEDSNNEEELFLKRLKASGFAFQ